MNISSTVSFYGRAATQGYSLYPTRKIFHCNIPKNASSSVKDYIENKQFKLEEDFYFTVIREPKERLLSALWWITKINNLSNDREACRKCGYITHAFNVKSYIKNLKGIEDHSIRDELMMHAFPQTEFIKQCPYRGNAELKLFRLDQINKIFNAEMPLVNLA